MITPSTGILSPSREVAKPLPPSELARSERSVLYRFAAPNQVYDLRAHLCDCQFFQQGAKLHDRRHLAGGKILPGAQRPFLPIRYETPPQALLFADPGDRPDRDPGQNHPGDWRNKAEASGCELAVVNGQLFPRLQGHLPGIYDLKRGDSAALQLPAHHSCEWADRSFVDVRHLKPCRIQFVARPP